MGITRAVICHYSDADYKMNSFVLSGCEFKDKIKLMTDRCAIRHGKQMPVRMTYYCVILSMKHFLF